MVVCASGILMSALALGLIITDIYNDRFNYIVEHAILGGIVSILFFTMCNYGFEIFNWVLLSSIPFYMFMRWVFSETRSGEDDDDCDMCKKPKRTCGCHREHHREHHREPSCEPKKYKKPHTCPAEGGLTMGDECGISRFT